MRITLSSLCNTSTSCEVCILNAVLINRNSAGRNKKGKTSAAVNLQVNVLSKDNESMADTFICWSGYKDCLDNAI